MDLSLLNIPNSKIKQLEKKGIFSLPDLLKFIPSRYYDFRQTTYIKDINDYTNMCAIVGKVIKKSIFQGKVLSIKVNDGTGIITLSWFHNIQYINNFIIVGNEYIFCGKPYKDEKYKNQLKMSPILFNKNIKKYKKIIPVYKKIEGMSSDYLKDLINQALILLENSEDFLLNFIKKDFNLIDEYAAFKKIHQPKTLEDIEKAKERFIFDDLFIWNFILKSKQKKDINSNYNVKSCKSWHTLTPLLPFELTEDQKKSLKNIYALMKNKKIVNALVQGDVGSGKTIVAEFLLALSAEHKFQSCLIAPTEVLAKQHFKEISERFKILNYNVSYLVGNLSSKERKNVLEGLKTGEIDIVIGTHAIMGKDVVFKNLGMVICDEEHRFGVLQREFYKKDDNFYIENLPYVAALNKKLQKLKFEKANIFFRNISLDNYDLDKEIKIFNINIENVKIEIIKKQVENKLNELLKKQNNIKSIATNLKYLELKKQLLDLLENNKKTTKFFKDLNEEDLYALYYLYNIEIKLELKKERPIPHQITMSATPIPRTLAMSIYGDDIKVFTIKSKPNGRKPIITKQINDFKIINDLMISELNKGFQSYIVCPLIEDSESEKMSNIESVNSIYNSYVSFFKGTNYKVGMINGDMKQEDINNIIQKYINKEIHVLVSTTIIEVGVNNPNSTFMLICSSDRFGLSSLHQIRGRVGRSNIQSYCILKPNNIEDKKAKIMCSTTDGFKIAKYDLEMRGTGNFIGTKQSGSDKYVVLMLSYSEIYQKISKLNDIIYNTPKLFDKYSFLLNSELNN